MTSPWELPDLVSLRLLVEVLERRSIGAAARHLGMSQPAASERLAGLERRLGIPLCLRGPAGVRATPAGEVVRDWAAEILAGAERLAAGVTALREEQAGQLRVASSLTVADYLVPGWVHALRRMAPEATVRLEVANSTEVVRAVAAGAADLGFIEGGRAPDGLAARSLRNDELVVVVATDHPWSRRQPPRVSAAELASIPLVVREEGSGTRDVLERALRAARRRAPDRPGPGAAPFRIAFEVGSTQAIKAAVLAGDGPAVVSALAVADELGRGELVAVEVDGVRLSRRLRAVWRDEAPPTGAGATLLAIASGARRVASRPPRRTVARG